MILTCDSF